MASTIPVTGWGKLITTATIALPVTSGIKVWFDISRVGGYSNGQSIPYIKDYSGNNNHGRAVSTARFATAQTPKGMSAIDFQGTGGFDLGSRIITSGSGEAFIVLKTRSQPNGLWTIGSCAGNSDETHYPFGTVVYDNFGRPTGARRSFTPTTSIYNWCVYNVYSAPSDWAAYLNGTLQASSATVANPAWSEINWHVGVGSKNGAIEGHYNGWIAEFVFYNRKLSSGERTTMTNFLTSKHL